jgi:DNA-directed RNA polymerase beta subunit
MAHLNHAAAYQELREQVLKGIGEHFPVNGKIRSLSLDGLSVRDEDLGSDDIEGQKEAKLAGHTWSAPVYASLKLTENSTGKVLDSQTIRVAEIPKVTRRHSFIIDGQEYQVANQWQLKPGAYVRRKQTGELETQFNIAGKPPFKLHFEPDTKRFLMERGSSSAIPLYSILRATGVDDGAIEQMWGKEIFNANRTARGVNTALERFYRADKGSAPADSKVAHDYVIDALSKSELRPDATQITLGKPFSHVSGEALASATAKMLKVHNGAPEDDRDSLVFKDLRSAADYAHAKLTHWKTKRDVLAKMSRKINFADTIRDVVKFDMLNSPLKATFTNDSLSSTPSQTNPVEMLSNAQQTTVMGEGGIQRVNQVNDEVKFVNPSHLGFLDPIHTPESEKTGVVLHLPLGVQKVGRQAKVPLYNLETKKTELVGPELFMSSKVVLPDQVTWKNGEPTPRSGKVQMSTDGNKLIEDSFKSAQYVMRHPSQLFDIASNLIPFLGNNSGNRATYATHHIQQAVSLNERDAPLVMVGTGSTKPGLDTFEALLGRQSGHPAPVGGTVSKVTRKAVTIRDEKGKQHAVQLYDNFPLNDPKAVLHSTPTVAVGDKVEAGETVADTNFMKNGKLALGRNLRVAYIPFKGYNFEDGVVLSETAAKKLSSLHLHKPSIMVDDQLVMNPRKFSVHHPGAFSREQLASVGEDGVARVGTRVEAGDPLVVAMRPYQLKDRMGLGAIRRSLSGQHSDVSLRWESDYPGEVVDTSRDRKGQLTVHVRSIEPMQIGDKIAGRHGNKGIVSMILPDKEMPHTKDGKHIEVALNPSGIPGRINVGQVLETAAAKIAEKTKKPYIVDNFDHGDALARIKDELKQHGLTDTEELHDPVTGVSLGKALVGPQYMLKLTHQIDKKIAARAGMGLPGGVGEPERYDVNLMPASGGKTGGQRLDPLTLNVMLAHGARANIREAQTWKSEGADPQTNESKRWPSQHTEVWTAIQSGTPIPLPRPTFAFQKFTDMLRASGINIEKKGQTFQLSPMTDKQVLSMSNGALPRPIMLTKSKLDKNGEPEPYPGGLFDPQITGGHGGKKWSHIKLSEPVPNPIFEGAIRGILGLTTKQYSDLVDGEHAVTKKGEVVPLGTAGSLTGGHAIKHLLDQVNVEKELEETKAKLTSTVKAKGVDASNVDKMVKKVKHLQALDRIGIKPADAYVLSNLPVIPPVMRPVSMLPGGKIRWADLNGLYAKFAQVNQELGDPEIRKTLPESRLKSLRADMYDGVRAIVGVGTAGGSPGKQRGFLEQISGSAPKFGYFQRTLMNRRQDLSMRSVIVPEPALGLDEVGIPEKKASTLFRPFVVRKMVEIGSAANPLEAQELIKKETKSARRALELVMQERPVILKRDPALHKHSALAFTPKLVSGRAIQIHPLVTSGFNADFDGDSIDLDTQLLLRINGEVSPRTGRELIELLNAEDGNYVAVTQGIEAHTYDGWRTVRNVSFHEVADKKKFRITLKNGVSFIASEDHSLMVDRAKVAPRELTIGTALDHVGVVELPATRPGWSYEKGVAYGNFLGDGCAEVRRQGGGRVSIACLPAVERDYLMDVWRTNFPNANPSPYKFGFHVNGIDLAKHFLETCGRYCTGKFVGDALFNKGTEFLKGMLAGYILADGSVEVTRSGSYLIRTWSRSQKLRDGMSIIATMLGLPHALRQRVAKGKTNYIISFGKEAIKVIDYRCAGKKGDLVRKARHEYETNRNDDRISQSARGFEILSIEEVEYNERMIDIEVDDPQHVFTLLGGVVVHNTMSAYVPISRDAVDEARKMFPSNNLFNEATGKIMYQPTLESALGLYKLSLVKDGKSRHFSAPVDVLKAVQARTLDVTHPITVGSMKTTAGRLLLADALPEAMRDGVIKGTEPIDKKGLDKLFTLLAKNHSQDFGTAANRLKDLGNGMAFGAIEVRHPNTQGPTAIMAKETPGRHLQFLPTGTHTLSLDDFKADKASRDPVFHRAHQDVDALDNLNISGKERDRRTIDIWKRAGKEAEDAHRVKILKDPTNLSIMQMAGVKPSWDQYKQMVLAPVLVTDASGAIVPRPITRSYSEGLGVGDYWTQMSGARRGNVMKVQEVSEPGALSKRFVASAMNLVITGHDCGTHQGVALPASSNDVHDRILAHDFSAKGFNVPAGTMLSPDVVTKIRTADKNASLVVRSPLKCEHGAGLCQKCAGLAPTGKFYELGTNTGLLAAQSLGERSVQVTLKAFHSGGVVSSGGHQVTDDFTRILQLTELPTNIPDSAVLAHAAGTVKKIEKDATGVKVHVGDHSYHVGKDRYGRGLHENLPRAPELSGYKPWSPPKVGDKVEAGQQLTDPNRTLINPHDLYKATKSMDRVHSFLTDELHGIYSREGVRRQHIETIVKAIGNLTKVRDPGDAENILPGEFQPYSKVRAMNVELVKAGKKPIEHVPVLKGVEVLPLSVQEDWMAKLQHNNLRATLQDAAATAGISYLHGLHPVPGIAFGAEFGLTSDHAKRPGLEHLKNVPAYSY